MVVVRSCAPRRLLQFILISGGGQMFYPAIVSNLIAIVGRPNVGKSALFNRIVGKRIAIVHDQPGVTRDRVTAEAEWGGKSFTLVDTGGIGLLRREKSDDVIIKATVEQVEIAIEAASAIILVVNVQEGIVPLDREVAGTPAPQRKDHFGCGQQGGHRFRAEKGRR